MGKKQYHSRNHTYVKKEDVQTCGEELERISKRNKGKLKPENVVQEAKDSSSIFHDYFEWNNSKAAEQHRLQQARVMIANIVEVVVIEGEETKQRSFFSVKDIDNKGLVYVNLDTAISVKEYRVQLIDRLITGLKNATQLMEMFKNNN